MILSNAEESSLHHAALGAHGRVITVPVAPPSTDFRKALATSADFTAGKPGKNSS